MSRPPVTHVVLIDGTFASLMAGRHSNIGRIYRLLRPLRGVDLRVRYAAGQQWEDWGSLIGIAMGHGMGSRIRDAYGWLATAYRPGDRIILLGYSRGAFAIRSLAGMIGQVGLLRAQEATTRNIRSLWRNYRTGTDDAARAELRRRLCHDGVPIAFLGVFDTVMALGIRLPMLWMLTEPRYRFHDQQLGGNVQRAAQALALNETRKAYQPILWRSADHPPGAVRQMWFRGYHSDIGGQLWGAEDSRPLANIPLVWMLDQAEAAGMRLPDGWRARFRGDADAPPVGNWRGWGKAFLARAPRLAGHDASEDLHGSVARPYGGPAVLTGHLAPFAEDHTGRRARRRQRHLRRAGNWHH
ncbi:Uncharacterized protein, PA2063/DUF2235 family [Paracoccus isoporae]|uniref:Uncharacterized protein, PA2063/DUF2235 family n=1 Tax=Paracoccus isoporae TaxID=591205 RepID=A0A1G6YSX7_9RHOB|nr:DUF2235 domain-containing protein [Paracoccus isoporae]SDD93411.1 Uncharacterized protein, PA2063/DUF2235 family [Paracoccus isoporae]